MNVTETTAASDRTAGQPPRTKRERHERKQRVLTHGAPSTTAAIADAIVVKDGAIFLLTNPDGSVPFHDGHGLGLYYHDCRFLDGYEMLLNETKPQPLVGTAAAGFKAVLELTNADFTAKNGDIVQKESIGIKWERMVDGARSALRDMLTFQNFNVAPVEFTITLRFNLRFRRHILRSQPAP